jgi:V-type H+-transporting ATPase proteolipid subunit
LCVGSGEAFNVGQFLVETSPYLWESTDIGLCVGFSVLGAGWCVHYTATTAEDGGGVKAPAYEPRISSGLYRHLLLPRNTTG